MSEGKYIGKDRCGYCDGYGYINVKSVHPSKTYDAHVNQSYVCTQCIGNGFITYKPISPWNSKG